MKITEHRTKEILNWLDDHAADHALMFEEMAMFRDAAALIRQQQAAEQAAWHAGLDAGREQGRRNRLAEAATHKRELDSAGAFHFSDNGDDIEARIAQQPAAVDEAMVERIAAMLHEEATGEPWTVAGVAHPGPDRDYYRGLARRVAALAQQHAAVDELAARLVDELDGLVSESDGVSGLHLNGDVATWEELLPGGRFERLSSLDDLREALAAQAQPKRRPYNASGSLSEYGVFPECDVQQPEAPTMTADVELLPCGECGMPCRPDEYHPFAACLMFKACRNSATVRGNLQDAQDHFTAPLRAEIEALRVEVAAQRTRADAMAGEAIKHEARAERLAEALRPLAELDLTADDFDQQPDSQPIYARNNTVITVGDVRKARAALVRQLQAAEQAAWHAGLDEGREQGRGKDHAHPSPSVPVGVEAQVSALQSVRDRMMAALTPKFGDAFDGDFDVMLEAINTMKRFRMATLAQQPASVGVKGLPRYGFPDGNEPRPVPCADGYWTPWHLAQQPAAVDGEEGK